MVKRRKEKKVLRKKSVFDKAGERKSLRRCLGKIRGNDLVVVEEEPDPNDSQDDIDPRSDPRGLFQSKLKSSYRAFLNKPNPKRKAKSRMRTRRRGDEGNRGTYLVSDLGQVSSLLPKHIANLRLAHALFSLFDLDVELGEGGFVGGLKVGQQVCRLGRIDERWVFFQDHLEIRSHLYIMCLSINCDGSRRTREKGGGRGEKERTI